MNTESLRKEFKKDTGSNWLNGDNEPDIDYVEWLENKVCVLSNKIKTMVERRFL